MARASYVLTVSLSVSALVLSLSGSSLLHVHKPGAHEHGRSRFGGTLLHSHLPKARPSRHETDRPAFEIPPHDGTSVDLFLSLAGKQVPVAVGVEVDPGAIPQEVASRQPGTELLDRTHDPPLEGTSPRAPPI